MLKKIMLIAALVTIVPLTAGAQEAAVKTKPAQPEQAKTQEERLQIRQEKVLAGANQVAARAYWNVDQLNALLARIGTRITKMEQQGIDVSKAKTAMTDAQTLLDQTKASLEGLAAKAITAASSTTPVKTFAPVKKEIQTLIKNLNAIQKKVMDAIKILKDKTPKPANATSTAAKAQ